MVFAANSYIDFKIRWKRFTGEKKSGVDGEHNHISLNIKPKKIGMF